MCIIVHSSKKTLKKKIDKFCYWILFSTIKSDTKIFKNIFLDKKPGCGREGVIDTDDFEHVNANWACSSLNDNCTYSAY